MKERPILFSATMVRAILDGSKTQTRRVVKPQFHAEAVVAEVAATTAEGWQTSGHSGLWWDDAGACFDDAIRCPYGMPGDRLWVREAWRTVAGADDIPPRDLMNVESFTHYEADSIKPAGMGKLRPGMFMPRWASRITLGITGVRVQRLQDISEQDARAEGARCADLVTGREVLLDQSLGSFVLHFRDLWDQINGAGAWDANPWVWVVEFKRVK